MRTLTVVATSLGLAVGGLLAPAVASAACTSPACGNEVESGTLTLSIQSGQLTLREDGLDYTVRSGWLTLGGVAYTVTSGTLTLSHPDAVEYHITSGQLTLGGTAYHIEATAIEY
jgi:hypothetical protein